MKLTFLMIFFISTQLLCNSFVMIFRMQLWWYRNLFKLLQPCIFYLHCLIVGEVARPYTLH